MSPDARAVNAFVLAVVAGCVVSGCSSSGARRSALRRGVTTTLGAPTTTSVTTTTVTPAPLPVVGTDPAQRDEPALPVPMQEAAAAVIDRDLYVIGGYDASSNSSAAVFVFDGQAWGNGPPLPIAVNHPGAAAIGNDVYVAGGFTPSGATNRVFVHTRGSVGWREIVPMQRARGALALLSIDGRLYAIGGRDGTTQIAVPEMYDPHTNTWSDLPSMPAPRNHVGGFVEAGRACVAGGRTPATSAAIDCFDLATQQWNSRATLPTATSGAAATVLDGALLVAGGEPSNETSVLPTVQRLRAGTWTTEPMLVPRHGTAFAVYQGRMWACGGATAPGFHAVATCTSILR